MKTRKMRDDFQVDLERDDKMTLDHGSQTMLEIYKCGKLKERWISSWFGEGWISSRLGERLRLPSTFNCVRDGG
jgi:hypothetical protein